MITFRVMDKKTRKEADVNDILESMAAKNELFPFGELRFFVGEDGRIMLTDYCGHYIILPEKRYYVLFYEREVQP